MPRLVLALAVVLALVTTSCGVRTASRSRAAIAAELGEGRALLSAGCFQCLEEAWTIFQNVNARGHAPADARRGAFEAALLLALRANELGLPDAGWWTEAQHLAGDGLPSEATLPAPVYLRAARLVSGDTTGLPPEEREERARAQRQLRAELTPARAALDGAAGTDIVARYLALALDCDDPRAMEDLNVEAIIASAPPLLRYRAASCGRPHDATQLAALRASDARWRDTLVFEARYEISKYPAPDIGRAAELLALAHEAFPASNAISLALGNARNALNEYDGALRLFDSILDAAPAHREALLGRLLSLSYLNRFYVAIATATRMIDLGTFYIGDAYYWRAWNRYQVHDLPAAWNDVEQATKLMVNTSVYTLAGFIAYARRDLDIAIERLVRAYKIDPENCEAVWTEGLVHVDKEDWLQAAAAFVTSSSCFAADVQRAREEMTVIDGAAWSADLKARRTAAARKRADISEHRRAQSAYNAAGAYARTGHKAQALTHLDAAADHPLMREKAAALRLSVEKMP